MNNILRYKKTFIATCIALAVPFAIKAAPMHKGAEDSDHAMNHCENRHRLMNREMELGMGLPPHLKHLALSDAQQDKVFSLTYPLIPQIRDQMKQRRQLMDELHQLGNAESFDEAKAKQVIDKLANIEKETMLNRARIDSKIFSILTPEQRTKLAEVQNKMTEEAPPEAANFQRHHNKQQAFIGA